MTAAEKYVAGAYLVVFMLVLAYVLIIAAKLQRLEQALEDISSEAEAEERDPEVTRARSGLGHGKHPAAEAQTTR